MHQLRGEGGGCSIPNRSLGTVPLFWYFVGAQALRPYRRLSSWPGFFFGGGDPPLPFLPSREEKEASPQPRAGKFAGYMSGAKRCLFLFSGSSRPKSGACFCSADRRGENRGSVFVQRIVAAKIRGLFLSSGSSRPKSGGLFLFSGSSRRKSGACFCSADRRGQNRGCEFVQQGVLRRGISHTPLKTLPASWPGFLEGA